MNIIIHESFVNIYNKDPKIFTKVFRNLKTISTLTKRIEKISESYTEIGYDSCDKLKGDLFEIFAEAFFKLLSSDNRVGVYKYKPVLSFDDYGVDGYGIGMNDLPLTVQVKYRVDFDKKLLERDIKQFGFQSITQFNVDAKTNTNMLVFTNADSLHWITDSRTFSGSIKCIGNKEIKKLINNNHVFWSNLNDMLKNTARKLYGL